MKKVKLALFLSFTAIIATSCTGNPDIASLFSSPSQQLTSHITNEDTSITSSTNVNSSNTTSNGSSATTNNNSSSGSSTQQSSSSQTTGPVTIYQAITMATQLSGSTVTGEDVTIKGKMIGNYDDTGTHHVAAIMDSTGLIYVRYPIGHITYYTVDKNYIITGKVSKHYDHIEVLNSVRFTETSEQINVNVANVAQDYSSIATIYDDISLLPLSSKGTVYDKVITFSAQYIAKANDNILLVSDAERAIQVHGDNKINNRYIIGDVHQFIGLIGIYKYKPSIKILSSTKTGSQSLPTSYPTERTINATTLKRILKEDENLNYFPYYYNFSGYVEYHEQKETFVLVDQLNKRFIWQSNDTTRVNAEGLYVRNEMQYSSAFYIALEDAYYDETIINLQLVIYDHISTDHAWYVHIVTI